MRTIISVLVLISVIGCSLKPERLITRGELKKHRIYQRFVISESPEQVLEALNKYGEVVLSGKRKIKNRDLFVHVKILATNTGLEVVVYDR